MTTPEVIRRHGAPPQTPGFCEAWQRTQNASPMTLCCRKRLGGRVGRRRARSAQRAGPRLNVKGGALPPGAHAKGMGKHRPRTDSPANPGIKRSPCLACGLRRGRATFTQHEPTSSTMTTCRTKNFHLPSRPPIRYQPFKR